MKPNKVPKQPALALADEVQQHVRHYAYRLFVLEQKQLPTNACARQRQVTITASTQYRGAERKQSGTTELYAPEPEQFHNSEKYVSLTFRLKGD